MSIYIKQDYSNKDEFWQAVRDAIIVGKNRPSPSGYHQFYGYVYFKDREMQTFTRYKELLSTIGKSYHVIESVEVKFMPAPYGIKPKPW